MKLIIQAKIQIQKPIATVFENIVTPEKMTQYFIGSSTGRMEEKAELLWTFPEFEEQCPITVTAVVPNQKIVFVWDTDMVVTIQLTEQADKSTLVHVTEDGKENNEKGIKWYGGNTEGWANFLACLKAFSEYDINLRKGAFEFMKRG
ncbi:SRPBCC domain-containing protein [Flavobacterium orientale]|uniref:Activator of HSP90 ATPase n=1 Tax=Flavobacterium orientale TaxID=1756020 RepID=A0A917D9Z4_9FLAO|nr:SRPBCC domain-containing protein [Flavobacterium orientale]GGD17922.1 activator of HSP90 ATPase [Flavobacterium orientale]